MHSNMVILNWNPSKVYAFYTDITLCFFEFSSTYMAYSGMHWDGPNISMIILHQFYQFTIPKFCNVLHQKGTSLDVIYSKTWHLPYFLLLRSILE